MSDTERFSADAALAKLTQFQRATVDHVIDVFYKQQSGKRFLVADETGLGKSVVASGVIAKPSNIFRTIRLSTGSTSSTSVRTPTLRDRTSSGSTSLATRSPCRRGSACLRRRHIS